MNKVWFELHVKWMLYWSSRRSSSRDQKYIHLWFIFLISVKTNVLFFYLPAIEFSVFVIWSGSLHFGSLTSLEYDLASHDSVPRSHVQIIPLGPFPRHCIYNHWHDLSSSVQHRYIYMSSLPLSFYLKWNIK